MVAIRILGYGDSYNPTVECPQCELKQEFSISLSNLEIKPLELAPQTPGQNCFEYALPSNGSRVLFKFLTGKDEEDISTMMESRKKKGFVVDNVISTRLQYSILAIDGNSDRSFLSSKISMMTARDSSALRHYIDKHEPGIEMKHEFSCRGCGHQEVLVVPMGPTFFWPNA